MEWFFDAHLSALVGITALAIGTARLPGLLFGRRAVDDPR